MEKLIRAGLTRILGLESYLSFVSSTYIQLIRAGFMKHKYPELFFLNKMIKSGDVCVDIGANVGYYSVFLSLNAGVKGKVYAVEPVELFAKVFTKNIEQFGVRNVQLFPYALGGSNETITMTTPVINGVFRHGLTKVTESNVVDNGYRYLVDMRVPDELFEFLGRLDFLKCDVEGYEVKLFPYFMKTISKFKPVIQMEISTVENRKFIFDLLSPIGYSVWRLSNQTLIKIEEAVALQYNGGDFYFRVL